MQRRSPIKYRPFGWRLLYRVTPPGGKDKWKGGRSPVKIPVPEWESGNFILGPVCLARGPHKELVSVVSNGPLRAYRKSSTSSVFGFHRKMIARFALQRSQSFDLEQRTRLTDVDTRPMIGCRGPTDSFYTIWTMLPRTLMRTNHAP